MASDPIDQAFIQGMREAAKTAAEYSATVTTNGGNLEFALGLAHAAEAILEAASKRDIQRKTDIPSNKTDITP